MSSFNHLSFFTVDRICAEIDQSAKCPTIDLSQIRFTEPYALIYLGLFIRKFNSQGTTFKLLPPALEKWADEDVIEKAFELQVSSRQEGGTGLSEVRDQLLKTSGQLFFSSGKGYYMVKNECTYKGSMAFELPGVQIECVFLEEEK